MRRSVSVPRSAPRSAQCPNSDTAPPMSARHARGMTLLDADTARFYARGGSTGPGPSGWWLVVHQQFVVAIAPARHADASAMLDTALTAAETRWGAQVHAPGAISCGPTHASDVWTTVIDRLRAVATATGAAIADRWSGDLVAIPAHEPSTVAPHARGGSVDRRLRTGAPIRLDAWSRPYAGIITRLGYRFDAIGRPQVVADVPAGHGLGTHAAFGAAATRAVARALACYEAAERYQTSQPPAGQRYVRSPWTDVATRAIDPVRLGFGSCSAGATSSPHTTPLHWVGAWSERRQAPCLVPAQEVWLQSPAIPAEPIFVQSTTSGVALGATVEEAAAHALLEVIERDAYLTAWYLGRPLAPVMPPATLAPVLAAVAGAFPTHHVAFADLEADIPVATAMVLATSEAPASVPAAITMLASALDWSDAAASALRGVATMAPQLDAQRWAHYTACAVGERPVHDPEDHYAYHAARGPSTRLDAMRRALRGPASAPPAPHGPPRYASMRAAWRDLVARVLPVVDDILVVDLTHPDGAAVGAHCVRVLVPGLQPIWFGAGWRRPVALARLQRLARRWAVAVPGSLDELSTEVHALG